MVLGEPVEQYVTFLLPRIYNVARRGGRRGRIDADMKFELVNYTVRGAKFAAAARYRPDTVRAASDMLIHKILHCFP